MKANELRLGSWFNYFHPENGFSDTQIDIGYLTLLDSEDFESSDYEFEPIPLTEEWLVKFGVKLKHKGCYEPFSDVWWYVEPNGKLIDSGEGIGWAVHLPEFVHEYQNLHFALTGEELVIKE